MHASSLETTLGLQTLGHKIRSMAPSGGTHCTDMGPLASSRQGFTIRNDGAMPMLGAVGLQQVLGCSGFLESQVL